MALSATESRHLHIALLVSLVALGHATAVFSEQGRPDVAPAKIGPTGVHPGMKCRIRITASKAAGGPEEMPSSRSGRKSWRVQTAAGDCLYRTAAG